MSVTGELAPGALLANRDARAGQRLVLSKALGTGVITTAAKRGAADDAAGQASLAAAIASMTRLNRDALRCAQDHGVSACTDVTGFGLLGHLRNIVRESRLAARVEMSHLPLLPGAREWTAAGYVPGGSHKNLEFLELGELRRRGAEDPDLTLLAADAQTSGGLLCCVDASEAASLTAALRATGHAAATIGELVAPDEALPAGVMELVF
jgi:selenide,water dikinase